MDNALYVTLSRQTALFRNMSVVANNIANVNTTGYKSEKMVFTDYIKQDSGGEKVSFAQDIATVRDMSQGEIRATGSNLDVALEGDGFFMVDTPEGQRYTRVGSLGINPDGELITPSGYRITDSSGGPLVISEGATNISIREDGMVQAFVAGAEEEVGRLGVMKFDNLQELQLEGSGLYNGQGGVPAEIDEYRMVQGSLEVSNVNSVVEMTKMIEVSRSVGSSAKIAKELHELILKALDKISRQG